MEITVSRQYRAPNELEYDYATGTYLVRRVYMFTGADPEDVPGVRYSDSTIPCKISFVHEPLQLWDRGKSQTIYCVPVHKHATREAQGHTFVEVTFEGHVLGTLRCAMEEGTKALQLLRALDGEAEGEGEDKKWYYDALGADGQGTQVPVPFSVYQVWQTLNYESKEGRPSIIEMRWRIRVLTGSVCEGGWRNPWDDDPADEGEYLYLGAQEQAHRDDTITFIHTFMRDDLRYAQAKAGDPIKYVNQAYFYWFNYDKQVAAGAQNAKPRYFGPAVEGRVLPIAGKEEQTTDKDGFGGDKLKIVEGGSYTFASLELTSKTDR